MKYFLLFLGVTASFSLVAQPQITQSDLVPVIGSTTTVDSVAYINVSSMVGANQTWDFSDIEITAPSYPYTWVQPANAGGGSNFPSADYAIQVEFVSIFLGLSNNEFTEMGYHLDLSGTTSTEVFSNPTIRFELPLTYGDSGSDTFESTTTSSFGSNGTSTGNITWDVVGYGTLVLPWGTFDDVLLVHDVEESLDVNSFGGFEFSSDVTNDVYTFYKAGHPLPLLIFEELTTTDIDGTTVLYMGTVFNASGGNAIVERGAEDVLRVFPNPTSTQTEVYLPQDTEQLTLWTTDGRLVQNFSLIGLNTISLVLSDLPSGVYVLQAESATTRSTTRVIKK